MTQKVKHLPVSQQMIESKKLALEEACTIADYLFVSGLNMKKQTYHMIELRCPLPRECHGADTGQCLGHISQSRIMCVALILA